LPRAVRRKDRRRRAHGREGHRRRFGGEHLVQIDGRRREARHSRGAGRAQEPRAVREVASRPGRLPVLSVSAKLLYSAFLVAALTGLLVSWKLYGAAVGEAGPRAYYAGEAASAALAAPAPSSLSADVGGPSLDLPQEVAVKKPMVEQISDRR